MLLAIDVGNTNINFAVFEGEEIKTCFRFTTQIARTSDEFGFMILSLLQSKGCDPEKIEAVIVATVVPGVMYSLNSGIIKYLGKTPLLVGVGTKTGLKIPTANPREIGADRVVDAVAAYEIYGGPVLIADFGTATTYDLILDGGIFEAGLTCPGLRISANALWNDTAKLPEIEIRLPESILAKDTVASMQAGLVYGCIGQTEYIISRMKEEAGLSTLKVVATGGLGKIIADATLSIDIYDPVLTMKGLLIIYEKNKGR